MGDKGMKFYITREWLERKIREDDESGIEEPGGIMACSPEIMQAAEECAGRKWDGSQEDAERLLGYFWQHPFI